MNLRKIVCMIRGHKYKLLRVITAQIREVACTRCKTVYGMNDNAQALIEMDAELYRLHDCYLNNQPII